MKFHKRMSNKDFVPTKALKNIYCKANFFISDIQTSYLPLESHFLFEEGTHLLAHPFSNTIQIIFNLIDFACVPDTTFCCFSASLLADEKCLNSVYFFSASSHLWIAHLLAKVTSQPMFHSPVINWIKSNRTLLSSTYMNQTCCKTSTLPCKTRETYTDLSTNWLFTIACGIFLFPLKSVANSY